MKRTPFVNIFILVAFLVNTFGPLPALQAQASPATGGDFQLPVPGEMIHLSPTFNPPILKGIKVNPNNPFRFEFILDKGDENQGQPGDMASAVSRAPASVRQEDPSTLPSNAAMNVKATQRQKANALKQEATKLIKYFLASLTIPEKDLWVNLSPYEKDRVIPQSFGLTEMGRDLLAEDYMLKQITASLIYPEDGIGKKFWKRVYEEAAKKYGTTNISVNTFNKVWIVPQKAVVYENAKAGTAYVVESKLKVMLEQDYLAFEKNQRQPGDMALAVSPSTLPNDAAMNARASQRNPQSTNALGSQIIREIVIPQLTKEINEGENFTQLRQVYNSLILAVWYKKKIKESVLEQVYADKNKIKGLSFPNIPVGNPEYIYQQYLKAFKKGVYNYIKEELDPITQETTPRKYFSGGAIMGITSKILTEVSNIPSAAMITKDHAMEVTADISSVPNLSKREKRSIASLIIISAIAAIINHSYQLQFVNSVGNITNYMGNVFLNHKAFSMDTLNIETIRDPSDRETIVQAREFVDKTLESPENNESKNYSELQIMAYKNKHINSLILHFRSNEKQSLTQDQEIVWRCFVAELVRYSYGSWLNTIGITDRAAKEQALSYLSRKTYLGYWKTASGYQTEGSIYINLSNVEVTEILDTAHHEPMHYFARAININQDNTYTQLVKASGIHQHDDITWLLASAYGRVQYYLMIGLMDENVDRGDSPLVTHEIIRDIPHGLTWEQQVRYIDKEYKDIVINGDPKWSYSQGDRLAIYASRNFGTEASDFFVRLYGTHHSQMNFPQMELAAAIKQSIIKDYYLRDLSSFDLENIIIDKVVKTSFKEDVPYEELRVIQGSVLKGLIKDLNSKHLIAQRVDGSRSKASDSAQLADQAQADGLMNEISKELNLAKVVKWGQGRGIALSHFVHQGQDLYRYDGFVLEGSQSKTVVIRIGHLFFIDQKYFDRMGETLRAKLGSNVIILNNLEGSNLNAVGFAYHITAMIHKMIIEGSGAYDAIDSGAGDGILSIVQHKLGGNFVDLVELDEQELKKAKEQMELNGMIEGKDGDFKLHRGDLSNINFIKEVSKEVRGRLLRTGKKLAVLSNIGVWLNKYTATNLDSMKFVEFIPQAELFIAGGYLVGRRLTVASEQTKISALGFSVSPDFIASYDFPESVSTWSAKRADQAMNVEKLEHMGSQERIPTGVYFAWQTYMTLVLKNTLFPSNTELVRDFKDNPDKYPYMKAIFEEANTIFPGVDFFALLGAKLSDVDPSIVRIGNILFSYGLVKEWLERGNISLQGINFTSGGVFPALLLSDSMTLKKGLPFIKRFFDDAFGRAQRIQQEKKTVSVILTGGPQEDILNLVNSIILLNSSLNQITFAKENRANNMVVVNGESTAVDVISDIFIHGGDSDYVKKKGYIAPEWMGDFIRPDPRHLATHIYVDLPVHTPQLEPPPWWDKEVKELGLKDPKFPIFGQTYEVFSTKGDKSIEASFKEALFGFMNTAGAFEKLSYYAPRIALVGSPDVFIQGVKNVTAYRTFVLRAPDQRIDSSMLTSKKMGNTAKLRDLDHAMNVSVADRLRLDNWNKIFSTNPVSIEPLNEGDTRQFIDQFKHLIAQNGYLFPRDEYFAKMNFMTGRLSKVLMPDGKELRSMTIDFNEKGRPFGAPGGFALFMLEDKIIGHGFYNVHPDKKCYISFSIGEDHRTKKVGEQSLSRQTYELFVKMLESRFQGLQFFATSDQLGDLADNPNPYETMLFYLKLGFSPGQLDEVPKLIFDRFYLDVMSGKRIDDDYIGAMFTRFVLGSVWALPANKTLGKSLQDCLWKNEEELGLFKMSGQQVRMLVTKYPDIPVDKERYVYKGIRLTPQTLSNILEHGIKSSDNNNGSSLFNIMISQAFAWGASLSPLAAHIPRSDFLAVSFQLDKGKNNWRPLDAGGNLYQLGNEDIPPDAILKVFIFDRLKGRFIEFDPSLLKESIVDNMSNEQLSKDQAMKTSLQDIANLLGELRKDGVVVRMHGQALDELVGDPQKLEDHFRQFSVIKDPQVIRMILQGKLKLISGKNLSEGMDLQSINGLFNALFDQERFLAQYSAQHPLNVVILRGGRGASQYTEALKNLPNVRVQVLLGAVDDGRSWYVAARDFKATGIPDAGKSLLDLAEDRDVKDFLSLRLMGEKSGLLKEDMETLVRGLESGEPQKFYYSQIALANQQALKVPLEKRHEISRFLKKFLETLKGRYSQSIFSLNQTPIRSLVLLGAAWDLQDRGDLDYWQNAIDEVGALLDLKAGSRVILPTQERQYLVAMTGDGTIYGAETGINEFLEKPAPFIGLWLMDHPFDINSFKNELKKSGINAKLLSIHDPKGKYDSNLKQEIESTTLRVSEMDAYKTASLLAKLTTSGDRLRAKPSIKLNPAAQDILAKADAIVFGNTTFESNIGSSLVIPGMGEAIEANANAVKIHIVNPTSEAEPYGTTALSLLERLYRYATRQFLYTHPASHWQGVDKIVNYMIGVPTEIPGLDPLKTYLPFGQSEIIRATRARVTPIPLDLEIKKPTAKKTKSYMDVNAEWGFYDPQLLREATIALTGIRVAGYKIKANGELIKDNAMNSIPSKSISLSDYEELQKVSQYGNEVVKAIGPNQRLYGINIWGLYHQVRKNMIGYFQESSEVEALQEFRRQFRVELGRQLAEKDEMAESIRDVVERVSNAVFPLLINEHNLALRRGHLIKVRYMKDFYGKKSEEITAEGELSGFKFYKAVSDLELNFNGRRPLRLSLIPDPIEGYSPYIEDVVNFEKPPEVRQDQKIADLAMRAGQSRTGGIDLTPTNMNLQMQNNGRVIKFHMDSALLAQLQEASGFVPVIINIQPLKDLKSFLGVNA